MKLEIVLLNKEAVGSFYPIFATTMKTVFTCYSPKIIDFFINKVYTPVNLIYWLNNNLKTVVIAKEGDKILGFAMIDQPYGGVSFCRWLGVLKKHQKKGIGRKLVQAWEKLAKSQSCHKIELASQPLARKFYEKVGLKLEGERKLSYFGTDQFIFGKIIGKPNEDQIVRYY